MQSAEPPASRSSDFEAQRSPTIVQHREEPTALPGGAFVQDGKKASIDSKVTASSLSRKMVVLHRMIAKTGMNGATVTIVVILIGVVGVFLSFLVPPMQGRSGSKEPFKPDERLSAGSAGRSSLASSLRSPLAPSPLMSGILGSSAQILPPTASSLGSPLVPALSLSLQEANVVPAICPSLILPHTEARFMIPMQSLISLSRGSIDIMGTSGRKLLHALVCDSPDGRRCLMLASCGCEDDPRTCVFTPQATRGSYTQALEVFGKAGKFYGWLEHGKGATLMHSGAGGERRPVLQFSMGNQQDRSIRVDTMDGQSYASCGNEANFWKLQAKPGADAVLVASCMLGLILLAPWPDSPR
jgi:hypothetical protein